jgi:hypothetical protein
MRQSVFPAQAPLMATILACSPALSKPSGIIEYSPFLGLGKETAVGNALSASASLAGVAIEDSWCYRTIKLNIKFIEVLTCAAE